MNQAHVHLVITHLPIFGSLIGALILIYALTVKSNQAKIAGYGVLFLSAIGATIAYLTGEGAEETVEHLPGIAENLIEQHEEFALFALVSMTITGVLALVSILVTQKNGVYTRRIALLTLLSAIISFMIVVRTGYLGGQIHHTEIGSNAAVAPGGKEAGGEEEDDD